MQVSVAIESAPRGDQDRAVAFSVADGVLLALADGAGGISGGAKAAQAFIDRVSRIAQTVPSDWSLVLREIDRALVSDPSGGQTTGVVAFVRAGRIVGASVGDSGAWLISADAVVDLTESQNRKPLVGSGSAVPVSFDASCVGVRVLLASDGLLKYAASQRIRDIAASGPLNEAALALVNCVRLRSGTLQDDVAVVIAG
jgi:serine/threonine protein phosphatase PrpC